MHPDLALRMMNDLLWTAIVVAAPILGLTMLVGVIVSIVQVVTQLQEMSLTFIPKFLVAAISLAAFGSWMLRTLSQYWTQLWAGIPSMF
jgi:flagellar biosynthetic protein FliQ